MNVIVLDKLSKWYGEVIGLNNVTTRIGRGITGLLGPNGAGKSTLMGLIMGQLRPSQGCIEVFGEDPWDNPHILSQIGYCPEGDPFWPKLTGYEFVRFLARLSGLRSSAAKKAVDHAIEITGMTQNAHRAIRGYSKGMRQRIKISQALVHRPRLLILDEPLTGADPIARHDLSNLLRNLAGRGVDILISSHILHEVEAITRQILMIDRGRIVAQGDVHAVRRTMLDRPHAIRVRLREPRKLASRLAEWDAVTRLTVGAESVVFETPTPEPAYERLCNLILEENLSVWEVAAADDNLEAVFGYLTRPR